MILKRKNPKNISLKRIKTEFEKIDYKLLDRDEEYWGNDLVKIYSFGSKNYDLEILYNYFTTDPEKSYFYMKFSGNRFSSNDFEALENQIEETEFLLKGLEVVKKLIN